MAPGSGFDAVCAPAGFAACCPCKVPASRATAKILRSARAKKSISAMLQEMCRSRRYKRVSTAGVLGGPAHGNGLSTVSTTFGIDRDLAQTLWALLGCGIGRRWGFTHTRDQEIHR